MLLPISSTVPLRTTISSKSHLTERLDSIRILRTPSFASGSAAGLLGLTQGSGAIDFSPGGQHPSIEQWMTNVLLHDTNQFGQSSRI